MGKSKKNKAVFLDRDGTLNVLTPREYILHNNELRLLPGTAVAVKKLNSLGYLVVLITNQGVIGRRMLTKDKLEEINGLLVRRIEARGGKIDGIYYCPHHPQATLQGYAVRCRCRKPNTGLIAKAIQDFTIDKKKSFFVGDTTLDVLTGKKAGLKTILVKTGYGGKDKKYDVRADAVAENLEEAVDIICKRNIFTHR